MRALTPPLPPPPLYLTPPVLRAQAYLRVRQQEGMSEMGDLVLGLATELMTCGFDFQPTFTSPFDVSPAPLEKRNSRAASPSSHQRPCTPLHPRCMLPNPARQTPPATLTTKPPCPAHQVSNKCVELLMLRQGCDVCCTSDSDRTAIQRFEAQLAAERQQASG